MVNGILKEKVKTVCEKVKTLSAETKTVNAEVRQRAQLKRYTKIKGAYAG
jgi:hypothetical protein